VAEPVSTRPLLACPRRRSALGAFLAGVVAAGCAHAVEPARPSAWSSIAYVVPPGGRSPGPLPGPPQVAYASMRIEPRPGTLPPPPSAQPPPSDPGAAPPAGAGAAPERRYAVQPGVLLPPLVQQKVALLALAFFRRTGKELVITSGTRDAAQQAEAMHELFRLGADVMGLYRNKPAAREIQRAYQVGSATGRPASVVIAAMAEVIRLQIERGTFISAHLRAGAFDVRNKDMSAADKRAFLEAVAEIGGATALEESRPPHFHLQVD